MGFIVVELEDESPARVIPLSVYVNDHGAVPVKSKRIGAVVPAEIVELPDIVIVGSDDTVNEPILLCTLVAVAAI
ncbi:hypothetical protein GCM10027592_17510 [Spirosoma flavus]